MMLQYIGIGQLEHRSNPIEETSRRSGGPFPRAQTSNVGTRLIHPKLAFTDDNEDEDHDDGGDQCRNQGREEGRRRRGRGLLGVLEEINTSSLAIERRLTLARRMRPSPTSRMSMRPMVKVLSFLLPNYLAVVGGLMGMVFR